MGVVDVSETHECEVGGKVGGGDERDQFMEV